MKKKSIAQYMIAQEFLSSIGGKYAVDVIATCEKKKRPVTDEDIGKHVPLKITEIRTILNKLHYMGIATYAKDRNSKTGWYSYTWEIKPKRIVELILEQQIGEIEKMEKKMDYEKNYAFFSCKGSCHNFPFEIAAEYQFKCPECGATMDSVDNRKRLRDLKNRVGIMKEEVKALQKIF